MTAIKRIKAYFFQSTSVVRPDGSTGGNRLKQTDQPAQQTFEDLLGSTTFSTESSDRAREYSGSTISDGDEQGLTVLATDAQVKANAAQLSDRSLVVQPHQMTTASDEAQTITGYNSGSPDTAITVTVDGSVTTRNKYIVKFKANFITYLNSLYSNIATNTTNIATLTATVAGLVSSYITSVANVGTGSGIYKDVTTGVLSLKSLLVANKQSSNTLPINVLTISSGTNEITTSFDYAALSSLKDEQSTFITSDTSIAPYNTGTLFPNAAMIDNMINLSSTSGSFKITPKDYTAIIPDVTSVTYRAEFNCTINNPSGVVEVGTLIAAICLDDYNSGASDSYVYGSAELYPLTFYVNTTTMVVAGKIILDGAGDRDLTVRLGKNSSINIDIYSVTLYIRAVSLVSTSLGTINII